jgi:hypothetical protein
LRLGVREDSELTPKKLGHFRPDLTGALHREPFLHKQNNRGRREYAIATPCYQDDAADKLKQGEEPIYSYELDIRALVEEQLLKWPGTTMEEMKPGSHK